MGRYKKLNILFLLIVSIGISGCAAMVPRVPFYLSDEYSLLSDKNVFVVPIIDAQEDKSENIKNIQDVAFYKRFQKTHVLSPLKRKGYVPTVVDVDSRDCGSVSDIENINDLNCSGTIDFKEDGLYLFLSFN